MSKAINREYKTVKPDEIKPYWRNPRIIDEAVEKVKQSIAEYGYINPIIVDKKMVIIAGHTRYKALKELGYEDVEVMIVDMTGREAKEYRIIDNKSGEFAQWSDELIPELKGFRNPEMVADFFPDLVMDFPELTIPRSETTQDDIAKTQGKLESHFENENQDRMSQMLKLVCPHCSEPYYLSRHDVLNNPSMEADDD